MDCDETSGMSDYVLEVPEELRSVFDHGLRALHEPNTRPLVNAFGLSEETKPKR